ncbi:MAG: hypothetical protein ACOY5W_07660 [Pseudomonadota bacterium]
MHAYAPTSPRASRHHRARAGLLLCGAVLAAPASVPAAPLELPLRVPIALIEESLRDDLGLQDSGLTEVFHEGACRTVRLGDLRVGVVDGRIRLAARAGVTYGTQWLGACVTPVDWKGDAIFTLEPYITEDERLRYRLLDLQLTDAHGGRGLAAGLIGKLLGRVVRPSLESFQIDLKPPRAEVAAVLHDFIPGSRVAEIDAMLASARTGAAQLETDSLVVPLHFEVPDHYLAGVPPRIAASEAPLTAEELARFAEASRHFDAFLVYIVKALGLEVHDPDIRLRLLELLLQTRYEIAATLAGEGLSGGPDPVRTLFTDAWQSLHQLVIDAGRTDRLRGRLLPYLSFLNAGDALFFFDHTAPGLGIEISADGLRRLARAIHPDDPRDPLRYDWETDPFLQELFDEGELPPPPVPNGLGGRWLDFLIPPAQAEELGEEIEQYAQRLQHWVPGANELVAYRTVVGGLLDAVRVRETARVRLESGEADVFRYMVPATALIESCWRQYVREQDTITHIRSPSGSVGMMQVNAHVWRGIFDVERLQTDSGYNVYAGTRILLRYLRLYARPVAKRTGQPDDIVRAGYAAYHAGPKAAARFLDPELRPRLRQIDEKFWTHFQALRDGGSVDLQSCSVRPAG